VRARASHTSCARAALEVGPLAGVSLAGDRFGKLILDGWRGLPAGGQVIPPAKAYSRVGQKDKVRALVAETLARENKTGERFFVRELKTLGKELE